MQSLPIRWRKMRYRLLPRFRRIRRCITWKRILILTVLIVGYLFALRCVNRAVTPAIRSFAQNSAQSVLADCLERAVKSVSAEDVLNITRDDSGRVSAIAVNADAINRYQAGVASAVQDELNRRGKCRIRVPIGSLTNINLFQGRGPRLTVHLTPSAAVRTEPQSSFSTGGINQTCHTLDLTVYASVTVLFPDGSSETYPLSATLCVAQTVIVGDVPALYRK